MPESEPVRESSEWVSHFRSNAENLLPIPWDAGVRLESRSREALVRSLQKFQLGESSEGKHLIACARAHAEASGDPAYTEAARLFILEEQRHARDLGRVLTLAEVPLLRKVWTDTVFRRLRSLAGLELSIAVLITAEIIAKVYYAAIREATHEPVLVTLCDQILRDEEAHVRFQAERLAILRRGRARGLVRLAEAAQRILFAGTCVVVWIDHGGALRAGGWTWRRYWRDSWLEWNGAIRLMDPRRGFGTTLLPEQLAPVQG